MTVLFDRKSRPIEKIKDLEANLRAHLGIPSSVESVEEEHSEDEIALTFELKGSDQIHIIAAFNKIIGIYLFIDIFDEYARDDDNVFQSFGIEITEEEARDLFSDIEAKLTDSKSRAKKPRSAWGGLRRRLGRWTSDDGQSRKDS